MEKILFVDDDEKFLDIYKKKFSDKYIINTANDAKDAIKMIGENGSYAVIVADMCMPGMDGIQFLEKAREKSPDSIRIMITGKGSMESVIQAINRGNVFHFLTKPCTKEEMKNTLEVSIDKYKENMNLKNKSIYDELTKVYNRRYFEFTIPDLFKKSNRATDKFSLIFIDINFLKKINDEFGHDIGDEAIVEISQVLKDMTRDNDMVARFGGDEFVIYAFNTDDAGSNVLVKRIKDVLMTKKLKHCKSINLSIAAGIATYPEDGKTYHGLLKIADKRMYTDKENEKNSDSKRHLSRKKTSVLN
jgi:diguanylate cyclase (GGDEF)-like protein